MNAPLNPLLTADEIVGKYIAIRDYIKRQEDNLEQALKPYRDALQVLEQAADTLMKSTGLSALQCKGTGTAFYQSWSSVKCADREAFHDWVFATNARAFLTAHVSKEAVEKLLEDTGTLPPGIGRESGVRVTFRKG